MTFNQLVWSSLGRNKLRTGLTTISILVAFVLFCLLDTLKGAFAPGVEFADVERLVTTHKVSSTQLLPFSYVNRIAGIEGVAAVSHGSWFGGYYQERKNLFAQFPVDPQAYLSVYGDSLNLPEAQRQAWFANQTGAIVGRALAQRFNWQVGDRISLFSMIYPQQNGSRSWQFVIEGIYDGKDKTADTSYMMFHYKYFDESRKIAKGKVGWFSIKVDDPGVAASVADRIDAMFNNSAGATKTSSENAFLGDFAKKFGNITLMITLVLSAAFFSMLLVTAHTMAESVRERTAEIAVLKTLGFSDTSVLTLVLLEALFIVIVGGTIGMLLVFVLMNGLQFKIDSYLPGLVLSGMTFVKGTGLMVMVGLAAGVFPAYRAMNLNVATALRRQ